MAKILIIDDEKSIRSSLREILEYEKYEVDEAVDGLDGINKITKNQYDIALCDIKMPKLDGIEVLEKTQELNTDIQFIMISAHGSIETAVEAVKKGAYDFIQKPFDIKKLSQNLSGSQRLSKGLKAKLDLGHLFAIQSR